MKLNSVLVYFVIIQLMFCNTIHSHGFGGNVYVKSTRGWCLAGQMQRKQSVASFDTQRGNFVASKIKAKGYALTNCYCNIRLHNSHDDIQCTPSQIFYVPEKDVWVPACDLQIGDQLLNEQGHSIAIADINFVKRPLPVCTFEIKDTHTFFVGSQSVLTHNMLAPFSFVGLSVAFGSGAATGGTAGTFFGPITLVGGVIIGGITGAILYTCKSRKSFTYDLHYDQEAIANYVSKNNQSNIACNAVAHITGRSHSNFPLYYAAADKGNDAQAPGKPTEKDGYVPPKKWNGEKVKHPKTGQYGYPDKKGNVWVPTGPGSAAHGGPHWDVIGPKGTHLDNVYPGGKSRKGKK